VSAEEFEANAIERQKTTPRIRGTLMDVEVAAQNLRRHMTAAERVLWRAIRQQQVSGPLPAAASRRALRARLL